MVARSNVTSLSSLFLPLILLACGDEGSSASTPTSSAPVERTPAERIADAESNGTLPKLDRATGLAGPDTNNNGVRDDIDAYIAAQPIAADQRTAALQLARALQRAILSDPADRSAVDQIALSARQAVNCLHSRFASASNVAGATSMVEDLEAISANTRPRLTAYLQYNGALDGSVGSVPVGDTCA